MDGRAAALPASAGAAGPAASCRTADRAGAVPVSRLSPKDFLLFFGPPPPRGCSSLSAPRGSSWPEPKVEASAAAAGRRGPRKPRSASPGRDRFGGGFEGVVRGVCRLYSRDPGRLLALAAKRPPREGAADRAAALLRKYAEVMSRRNSQAAEDGLRKRQRLAVALGLDSIEAMGPLGRGARRAAAALEPAAGNGRQSSSLGSSNYLASLPIMSINDLDIKYDLPVDEENMITVAWTESDMGSPPISPERQRELRLEFAAAAHTLPLSHLPSWLPQVYAARLHGPALEASSALAVGAEVVLDWEFLRKDVSDMTLGRGLRERKDDTGKIGGVVWKGPPVSTAGMPHNSNLLPSERKLCALLRLRPTQYLVIKHRLLVVASVLSGFSSGGFLDLSSPPPPLVGAPATKVKREGEPPHTPVATPGGSPPSGRSAEPAMPTPLASPVRAKAEKPGASASAAAAAAAAATGRGGENGMPGAGFGLRTLGKAEAQKMCRIDVNKTAKIWEYLRSRRWL